MAAASQKATPPPLPPSLSMEHDVVSTNDVVISQWTADRTSDGDQRRKKPSAAAAAATAMGNLSIQSVDPVPDSSTKPSAKGVQIMPRAQTSHPLDPLISAEISVAVATVRAAGATPEVRDSMRFIEVSLVEPEKHVVALADAYFFPPFQPSLLARTKGGPLIPSKLPPRQARLIVYNKKSNETSIWIVELLEVHAAARGGHHRGKVISSRVVPEVQPAMVECLKSYSTKGRSKFELLD